MTSPVSAIPKRWNTEAQLENRQPPTVNEKNNQYKISAYIFV